MLALDLYIHGAGKVTPEAAQDISVSRLAAIEPSYSAYLQPMQLRRMSKVVRIGIGAAKQCLAAAGIEKPDALSVGTAMGCLNDTEIFLSKMINQQEKMLTPTAFIQSTHNTVAGAIALLLGCYGHNLTYVQRGHSFEQALINTQLYLQDHPGETVLAGGVDEWIDSSFCLMQRAGVYTSEDILPASLNAAANAGAIAGEGATFFAINNDATNAVLRIKHLHLAKVKTNENALEELELFIKEAALNAAPIDLVILGRSGIESRNAFYDHVQRKRFAESSFATFKNICGEYATAAAYPIAVLFDGIKSGIYPEGFFINKKPATLRQVLLVNHFLDYFSFVLIEVLAEK